MQGRSQQGDLREVVEVARLQGGVLAVVGEAQELARLGAQGPVALHLDERPQGEDGGGGAPVVDPERRQLEPFGALASGVGDPARRLQAEQEVAADQGGRRSVTLRHDLAPGVHEDRLRDVLAGIGANPLDASGAGFLEGVRQAVKQCGTVGAGPGRLFGEIQVRVLAAVVVVGASVFPGDQCCAVPAVNGGVDPRINGEQRVSEATRCRAGHQEVASRQAASRLLRCAPALRVTCRNLLIRLAFMAGSELPTITGPFARTCRSRMSTPISCVRQIPAVLRSHQHPPGVTRWPVVPCSSVVTGSPVATRSPVVLGSPVATCPPVVPCSPVVAWSTVVPSSRSMTRTR